VSFSACNFADNDAETSGGGIYAVWGTGSLARCEFTGNTAGRDGGGIYVNDFDATVDACTFAGNAGVYGGGAFAIGCAPQITNCVFSGNGSSNGAGGGLTSYAGGATSPSVTPVVVNCTFQGNIAYRGGAVYNWNSAPTITNCVVWGNIANEYPGILTENYDAAVPPVTYCDLQSSLPGIGNISLDPMFLDAAGSDLRLTPSSPCVDAGDPATTLDHDRDGTVRPQGSGYDIGAFELVP
jgi:predicted outer membrane repeat protein